MGHGDGVLGRIALIPIRDFDGMTRLASVLGPDERNGLSRHLGDLAVAAVAGTTMTAMILTTDPSVAVWAASRGVDTIADVGDGLSDSVTNAVSVHAPSDWLVLHADMPYVTAGSVRALATAATENGHAIAPSVDGGTNVIAGTGTFRFSYGPASFHRHLSLVPNAAVVSDPALSIEIDTEVHLRSVMSRPLPPSLGL